MAGRSHAGAARRARVFLLGLAVGMIAAACASPEPDATADVGDSWTVTAWGDRFEVFPEAASFVVGRSIDVATHVTELDDFSAFSAGRVELVLGGPSGEEVFVAEESERPGLWKIAVEPRSAGERSLSFRIHDTDGSEEVPAGNVRVGSDGAPGAILVAPAPRGASDAGEPLSFLKEEQWRSDFATEWVRAGSLAGSVAGLGRVRPPAGGETTVTAPVAGVLQPGRSWPFVGMRVESGEALFRLAPHIAVDRSLATLEADLVSLDGELAAARTRLSRLEELLELEATSRREVEEARTRAAVLEASQAAAQRDLDAARSSREGGSGGALTLRAPFGGEVASVSTSPGATVAAGDSLVRLVETDRLWLEVALAPAGAQRLRMEGVLGVVVTAPEQEPLRIDEGIRLVSIAPELSARTGTVTALLEVPATPGLVLGSVLQVDVLLPAERQGVVVAASALVDDGGVPVVYLQLSGESFARQVVEIMERQGGLVMLSGLTPGQRLVTRGGDSIRRSTLMGAGDSHGHVH